MTVFVRYCRSLEGQKHCCGADSDDAVLCKLIMDGRKAGVKDDYGYDVEDIDDSSYNFIITMMVMVLLLRIMIAIMVVVALVKRIP